eukprot:1158274-Pelagomonas_calceolata.AAC.54
MSPTSARCRSRRLWDMTCGAAQGHTKGINRLKVARCGHKHVSGSCRLRDSARPHKKRQEETKEQKMWCNYALTLGTKMTTHVNTYTHAHVTELALCVPRKATDE